MFRKFIMDEIETIETAGGNTKIPPPVKQSTQCMHWCFTWNNYEPSDIETLETLFKHLCHKYCFQEETGANGTKHLQGVISLKKRARWTEFGLPKVIHWEKCQNLTKAYLYCSKNDTRTGGIFAFNYELPFTEEINNLYDWEKKILKILDTEPDKRTLYWIHEPNGCAGKTTFQKYVFTHYKECVVLSGKGADMKNGIVNYLKTTGKLPRIVLINIPMSVDMNYISYTGIEEVKDMFFFSGKYEGGMVCGKNPHVIIFANREPDYGECAKDRWKVLDISSS